MSTRRVWYKCYVNDRDGKPVQIEITGDLSQLAGRLGLKAASRKSGRATAFHGTVVAKVIKPKAQRS